MSPSGRMPDSGPANSLGHMSDVIESARRAIRSFRWGLGLVLITPVTLIVSFVLGDGGAVVSTSTAIETGFEILSIAVLALGAAVLVTGYALLWLGSRPKDVGGWMLRIGVVASAVAMPFWIPVAYAFVTPDPGVLSGLLVGFGTVAAGLLDLAAGVSIVIGFSLALGKGFITAPRLPAARSSSRRWATVGVGVFLLILVTLGLYVGLVDDLLAEAPGKSLASIYAALARVGDLPSAVAPLEIWAVFWTIPILLLFVPGLIAARPTRLLNRLWTPRWIITAALWIGGLVILSQWFADFAMGLDVAEDLSDASGGSSLLGAIYGLAGLILLAVAVVRTIAPPLGTRVRESGGGPSTPELGRDSAISI